MRVTVSPEQLKFFQINSFLELENLLSEEEAKVLRDSIKNVRSKSPGYPDEYLFRSIPFIARLITKRGIGQIAAELMHKSPLRLAYDKIYTTFPLLNTLDADSCGILIDLLNCKGIFFKNSLAPNKLIQADGCYYFFMILTARYLPEQIHPIVIR